MPKKVKKNPSSFFYKYYKVVVPAIIVTVTAIAYSNSFDCSFQLDDNHVVKNNPRIESFDHFTKLSTWKRLPFNRSFAYLTVAANYAIHGYDVWGYHFVNLLIHIIAAIAAFFIILKLFDAPFICGKYDLNFRVLVALFSSLLFALHPVQTQAVTYITQRMASLAAMFYFLAMLSYISGRLNYIAGNSGKSSVQFILCMLAFAFGAYSKATIYTLPLTLVCVELLFFRDERGLVNKRYVQALLGVLLIFSILFLTLKGFPRQKSELDPFQYFFTQLNVIVTYLRMSVLPYGLRLFYQYPVSFSPFELRTMLSGVIIISLIISATVSRKKYPLISFGIFFYFITQIIESSFFPLKYVIFEYRIYPALLGYGVIVSFIIYKFVNLNTSYKIAALSLIVLTYGFFTYQRNFDWKDPLTLWTDNAAKEPTNPEPYNHAGSFYLLEGNYKNALTYFNKSITLDSTYAEPYSHKSALLAKSGKPLDAIAFGKKAVNFEPDNPLFRNNLGYAYKVANDMIRSKNEFKAAIEIEPDYDQAWENLSVIYQNIGQLDSALIAAQRSIKLNPRISKYYNNRGNILYALKKYSEAENDFRKAVELEPRNHLAINNLGIIYSSRGEFDKAIRLFNEAISLNQYYADAYFNRCYALYNTGKLKLARNDLRSCLQLNPNHYRANLFKKTLSQN